MYIQTLRGIAINPYVSFSRDDLAWGDVIVGLSNRCRFAGQISRFLSVAEHSVTVAHIAPEKLKLAALLHDASAAYLDDVPGPWKETRAYDEYRKAEARIMKAVWAKAGIEITTEILGEVERLDQIVLAWEALALVDVSTPLWREPKSQGLIARARASAEWRALPAEGPVCEVPFAARSRFALALLAAMGGFRETKQLDITVPFFPTEKRDERT